MRLLALNDGERYTAPSPAPTLQDAWGVDVIYIGGAFLYAQYDDYDCANEFSEVTDRAFVAEDLSERARRFPYLSARISAFAAACGLSLT